MTNRIDDLVNSYMLREFRVRGGNKRMADAVAERHLKDCPDTYLVHPRAEDSGMMGSEYTGPINWVEFEATITCPHGFGMGFKFTAGDTLDGLIQNLEYHELRLMHEAFRESLKPAIREALVALQNNPRQAFQVNVGVTYPSDTGEKSAEAGSVVTDLPPSAIEWMLKQGVVVGLCEGDRYDQIDPDLCSCRWCRYAALTAGDRTWLEAHGFHPPVPPTPRPYESKDRRSIWIR